MFVLIHGNPPLPRLGISWNNLTAFGFPPDWEDPLHRLFIIPSPSRAPLATRPKIVLSNQLRAEYPIEQDQSTASAVHCSPMHCFIIPAL